ncbi:unnamed protein product [Orchesella dallaii]|uniref:Odorant receptor n=1 Tax=Orchesella dallaii TaxID=48710 RepID=A0ABP1SAH3_9HEXA
MLTPLQKKAFALHETWYFYLPPFPLQFDPKYEKLILNNSISSWVTPFIFMISCGIALIGHIYILFSHYYVQPRELFGVANAFMLIFGTVSIFILVILFTVLVMKLEDWIDGINHVFSIERRLIKNLFLSEYPEKPKPTKRMDILGLCACNFVLSMVAITTLAIPLAIHSKFDYIGYILDDLFPWNLNDDAKPRATQLGFIVIRIAVMSIIVIEAARFAIFILLLAMSFIESALICFKWMGKKINKVEDFLRFFITFKVAIRFVEDTSSDLLGVALTSGFWASVGLVWISIKGYGVLVEWLYVAMSFGAVVSLFIHALTLSSIKTVHVLSTAMIAKWRVVSKMAQVTQKNWRVKEIAKQVCTFTPPAVSYGPFFKLGPNFVMEFFSAFTEREMDTVIMFDL